MPDNQNAIENGPGILITEPMSIALNKPKLDNLAEQIWKSAERLRGKFKAYEYQNIIMPIIPLCQYE